MRGFHPQMQRQDAQTQAFADGGVVQGVKRFFGMDEERNARIAAYRAQQAQEKSQQQPAPAPAAAPERAVAEYTGMSAMKRREKAAGLDYANGGMVRGPGTGTSDDVPDEVPEGTYIMPADSTQAVGADKLAAMGARGFTPGGGKVPVNLSNGEFKMPPEQVHAVGVQALDQMKQATHQPVRGFALRAEPEQPRQFFANGGVVEDESKATPTGQVQMPAQPTGQPATANATLGQMHSTGSRSGAQMVADGISSGAQATVNGLDSAARGFFGAFQKAPDPVAAPLPGAARGMPGYQTDVQRGGGRAPAVVQPARAPAITNQPPAAPAAVAPASQPFDFDKFEPQPGEGAFRNEQTGEVTRLQDGPAPRGFRAWKEPNAVPRTGAPPAQRQDVRAPVLNPNGGVFSAMVDFANQKARAVDAIAANKGMRNDRRDDLNELRTNADIAATAGRLGLESQRVGIDGQRLGLDSQRIAQGNAIDTRRIALDEQVRGFDVRQGQRQERLYESYDEAKTPEERAAIAQKIRDLSGKAANPKDDLLVVGGGQEWDTTANTMRNVPQRVFDARTRQFVGQEGAQRGAPAAAPADPSKRVVGQTYTGPNGKTATWTGAGWAPI